MGKTIRKILFLGDSITEGAGASSLEKSYVRLVADKLQCRVLNYGISGTRIARQRIASVTAANDWDFQQRAQIMDKDADFVFVFGGTNDYGHGNAELGERESVDPYTFYGAMNNLVAYLISVYGSEKICFILPLRRLHEEEGDRGCKFADFVEIMKDVLERNKVAYIDFYHNGLPRPTSDQNEGFFCDGLHPNDKGHAWLSDRICDYVLSK